MYQNVSNTRFKNRKQREKTGQEKGNVLRDTPENYSKVKTTMSSQMKDHIKPQGGLIKTNLGR